jgi:uncharacterized OsmC-like protein
VSLAAVVDGLSAAIATDQSNAAAQFHIAAAHVTDTATEVSVRSGAHHVTVDEPTTLGGRGAGPNPVEYALAALGSCQVITYQFWAAKLGLQLDTVQVDVSGRLDLHGFLGLADDVRPGFQQISMRVRLTGPESAKRYAELTEMVDTHCPVLDLYGNPTPVSTELDVVPRASTDSAESAA